MSAIAKRRPKHLDLAKIRLPMPGFVSILHRVSGALMFLLIPLCLDLLSEVSRRRTPTRAWPLSWDTRLSS